MKRDAMRQAMRRAVLWAMHIHTDRRTNRQSGHLTEETETNVTRTRKTARNPRLQSLLDDLTAERFHRHDDQ